MQHDFHKNYQEADKVKTSELGKGIKKLLEGGYGFPTDDVKASREEQRQPFVLQGLSIMSSGQPRFEGYRLDSVVENLYALVERITVLNNGGSEDSSMKEFRVLRMPIKSSGNRTEGQSYVILAKTFYD